MQSTQEQSIKGEKCQDRPCERRSLMFGGNTAEGILGHGAAQGATCRVRFKVFGEVDRHCGSHCGLALNNAIDRLVVNKIGMAQLSIGKITQHDVADGDIELEVKGLNGYQTLESHTTHECQFETAASPKTYARLCCKIISAALFVSALYILLTPLKVLFSNAQQSFFEKCRLYQQEFFLRQEVATAQRSPKANVSWPSAVIDVAYTEREFGPLPIDPRRKGKGGQKIEDVLYKDEPTRKKRIDFIEERVGFINKEWRANSSADNTVYLANYNVLGSEGQLEEALEANQRDWLRLEAKFRLSEVREELPMCLIVPSFNNNADFRIEGNLNSLFTQNYSNYRVVVVNDASTDGSDEAYRSFFRFHAIDKQRYAYIENSERATTLPNLYFTAMHHCSREAIVFHIDGDDELIGRNILQVFNSVYQSKKAGVVYSNFYYYHPTEFLYYGYNSQYTDAQLKANAFRDIPTRFSQLRSYRNELTFKIDPNDLKDARGNFYVFTADHALLYPLLELACGRVHNVREYHLLYNVGTALNKRTQEYHCKEYLIERVLLRKQKYECSREFDERMKKQ